MQWCRGRKKFLCLLFLVTVGVNLVVFMHDYSKEWDPCAEPRYGNGKTDASVHNAKWTPSDEVKDAVREIKDGREPRLKPLYPADYTILAADLGRCRLSIANVLLFVFVVKSRAQNLKRRNEIRTSWGAEKTDIFRTFFVFGSGTVGKGHEALQVAVKNEHEAYGDIVQGNFADDGRNNRTLLIMAYQWIAQNCFNAKYVVVVDDTMTVSTSLLTSSLETMLKFNKNQYLIAGKVTYNSLPNRHGNCPTFVSVDEYPYQMWPPLVNSHFYVTSMKAFTDITNAMPYTLPVWLEQSFHGLVVALVNVTLLDNDEVITNCPKLCHREMKVLEHRFETALAHDCKG